MSDEALMRICEIGDCERPHLARGLCQLHYSRWYENVKRNGRWRDRVGYQKEWRARNYERHLETSRAKTQRWRERNPGYARQSKLRKFGLTLERYQEIFERQNGVCAICGTAPDPKRSLSIDHDHSCCPEEGSCGECVRGLLCQPCNTALGIFRDSPELLGVAIEYVKGGGAL